MDTPAGTAPVEPVIGMFAGTWDLLHPGHLIALREARSMCDRLVVALQVNPKIDRPWKDFPSETVFERWTRLSACQYVDVIVPYETENDLFNLLVGHGIHRRFIGDDWTLPPDQGAVNVTVDLGSWQNGAYKEVSWLRECEELDIEIVMIRRKHNYSSSLLKEIVSKNVDGNKTLRI